MKKEVLICLHGFGRKRTQELALIRHHFEQRMEVVMPNLFDPDDSLDDDIALWINRAFQCVEDYICNGYKVYLLGFSMGSIAAIYCAANLKVERCILLAPAFSVINPNLVSNVIQTLTSDNHDIIANFKNLPPNFYPKLLEFINAFKNYTTKLNVPTLIIHSMQDTIVHYQTVRTNFKKIASPIKQLILLEQGSHVLTEDETVNNEVVALIELVLNHTILKENI